MIDFTISQILNFQNIILFFSKLTFNDNDWIPKFTSWLIGMNF